MGNWAAWGLACGGELGFRTAADCVSGSPFGRGGGVVWRGGGIGVGGDRRGDMGVLADLAAVLGDARSGPTVRRTLDLAGTAASLDKIARARARARAHVWQLIEGTPAGFPWLAVSGKTLTGGLVIDMDATLAT